MEKVIEAQVKAITAALIHSELIKTPSALGVSDEEYLTMLKGIIKRALHDSRLAGHEYPLGGSLLNSSDLYDEVMRGLR